MATTNALSSYFTNLISNLMVLERQPLTRMTSQRDLLSTQKTDYSAVKSKLGELEDAVESLLKTDPMFALKAGRTVNIANLAANTSVVKASASSSAVAGNYNLSVTSLAKAQQRNSLEQSSANLPLEKTGTFWLGGEGTAATSAALDSSLTAVSTGAVADGLRELGTHAAATGSAYSLEVRTIDGVQKFRLLDSDGAAVAIDDLAKTDNSLTSDWQTVTAGAVDTRRGLSFTLGETVTDGKRAIEYTAAGVSIEVEADDSLLDIAGKINGARQPEGRAAAATVVGSYLVLTAAQTGTSHRMIYKDSVGLGLSNDMASLAADVVKASDAAFSVNNIDFTRPVNSGLTDVVSGLTINLASDAEGKTAQIQVNQDSSAAKTSVETFLKKFNTIQSYLAEKTSVTSTGNGTYTRGSLANETIFSDLRMSLFSEFMRQSSTSSVFANLRDIGLGIDDSLQASVTDASKLEAALQNNLGDVSDLLEEVMNGMKTVLTRFTGQGGYLEESLTNLDNQVKEVNEDIKDFNVYLTERESALTEQYAQMQGQLYLLQYMQQTWSSIASVNLSS